MVERGGGLKRGLKEGFKGRGGFKGDTRLRPIRLIVTSTVRIRKKKR